MLDQALELGAVLLRFGLGESKSCPRWAATAIENGIDERSITLDTVIDRERKSFRKQPAVAAKVQRVDAGTDDQ